MNGSLALRRVAGLDRRSLAEARIRRRTFALQLGVLAAWGVGALALAALLTLATASSGLHDGLLTLLMFTAASMTALAPGGVWAGRLIKQHDSVARMALVRADAPEFDVLSPALRALIADARLARSAIEGREFDHDVALRAVWEWLQRFAELPDPDHRELVDLGLDKLDVGETLRWTIAASGREQRGLALIAEQLRAFEHDALAAAHGPYR